jgi:hypothetical protein
MLRRSLIEIQDAITALVIVALISGGIGFAVLTLLKAVSLLPTNEQ